MPQASSFVSFRPWLLPWAVPLIAGGMADVFLLPFPLERLAFPVNLIVLVVLLVGTILAYGYGKSSRWWRRWTAATTSGSLIAAFGICTLGLAFFPELRLQHSWSFNALLLTLLCQLLAVILNYRGAFRLRFYANHIGLWLLLASLSLGEADHYQLRAAAKVGDQISEAYNQWGELQPLGYEVRVTDFTVDYHENGSPQQYSCALRINDSPHLLQVNHPVAISWKEDLYVVDCGPLDRHQYYCVLEAKVQPWQSVTLVGLLLTVVGALLLFIGKQKGGAHVA